MSNAVREVLIERHGQPYDDILCSFQYDAELIALLRALPRWAARFDGAAWRLHPAFIAGLINAAALRGYRITATTGRQVAA